MGYTSHYSDNVSQLPAYTAFLLNCICVPDLIKWPTRDVVHPNIVFTISLARTRVVNAWYRKLMLCGKFQCLHLLYSNASTFFNNNRSRVECDATPRHLMENHNICCSLISIARIQIDLRKLPFAMT